MSKVIAFEVKPSSKQTHITIILDETGSMMSCRDQTINSVNEYITTQQQDKNADCAVSLIKFSAIEKKSVRTVFDRKNLSDVTPLGDNDFKPSGMTNLYDAIGSSVTALNDADDNLVIIVTDGAENSSTEYNLSTLNALISSKKEQGYTFVYLGANQDAWKVGAAFGLSKGQTMTYDTADMSSMMSNLSAATSSYRSMRSAGDYTVASAFFGGDNAEK